MRPHRRPGLSLTEVLVALFVMALGLIALLTLFPLGAMQIGQALKDDRTAQTANQADAWVRAYWRDAVAPLANDLNAIPGDPLIATLDDANVERVGLTQSTAGPPTFVYSTAYTAPVNTTGVPVVLPTGNNLQPAGPAIAGFTTGLTGLLVTDQANAPDNRLSSGTALAFPALNAVSQRFVTRGARTSVASYPVFIDPLGYLSRNSATTVAERSWVGAAGVFPTGGATPLLLPRRNTLATTTQNAAYATCALTDDLTYQANGGAGNGTEPLNRQGRYNWAALIQRPDNSRPDRANLTILVFDGRPPFLASPGDEVVLTGAFIGIPATAVSDPPIRSISMNVPTRGADQAPLVRRGGWVTIASLTNGVRSVGFHRVTGLTTLDDATVGGTAVTPVAVDIDPPVSKQITDTPAVLAGTQVYLLSGLSEVFTRPVLTGN